MSAAGRPLSLIFYAAVSTDAGVRVPRRRPLAVAGRALNSTALAVSWRAPAATGASRWVTGYRVVVSPATTLGAAGGVPRSALPVETIVAAADSPPRGPTVVVVAGLDEFTPYTVAVAAFSAAGDGPFSDAIVVQTDEDGRGEHAAAATIIPPG